MIKRKILQKVAIVANGKLMGINEDGFIIKDDENEVLKFDTIIEYFKDKNVQISFSESVNENDDVK